MREDSGCSTADPVPYLHPHVIRAELHRHRPLVTQQALQFQHTLPGHDNLLLSPALPSELCLTERQTVPIRRHCPQPFVCGLQ